ncbi:hypothetical protein [Thiothrix subterranea]|jgi:hypothetical protein|uniref:Uncharacterized protein n=1 Tax=Thiothrix subterranea TaxID=2735563 RepID=A0AA51MKI3_9GAMM|nr:hypothetical protein [Thiothrix subterranea]MDQ5770811.1 hypothetical protein [Thiothrix subterranea]WML85863.1 hypothetical protein RCG00_16355 [Thiothrix subterranea]
MRIDDFSKWLEVHTDLGTRAQSDAKSRCKRIEKYEGDLDQHFINDSMFDLLERFKYSRHDQEAGISLKHKIIIKGDEVNGTASLLNAANLYYKFCLASPPKK